jgi:heptosyltransferase-1
MNSAELLTHDFRRILLIKLSAVGDVVHTFPVLNQLRRRYPAARIDWLVKPAMAELVRHHPAVSNVIEYPHPDAGASWTGIGAWLSSTPKLISELRTPRYDLVVDLHGQIRSAVCTLLTGAPVRIGFDRPRAEVRRASARKLPALAYRHGWTGAREGSWIAYSHHLRVPTLDMHAVDRYLRVGAMLGIADAPADFSFVIPAAARERAKALLRAHAVALDDDRPDIVLLAPGTIWETKQWTAGGFADVANHCLQRGRSVVLVGSPNERAICRRVAAAAPGAIDLCGQTTLSELAALTSLAAIAVTNDSGPLHLAVALGRPTISIFGPTDSLWVGPYGRADAVLEAGLSCAPCYLRRLSRCPYDHACMHAISPALVIDRIETTLAKPDGAADAGALAATRRPTLLPAAPR